MAKIHDTFAELSLGTPWWFTLSARVLPLGVLGQFLGAGMALFRDGDLWDVHETLGLALVVPASLLWGGALLVFRLRGFGWWAGLSFLLYLTQVALSAGAAPLLLSFHPFNGALLLTASVILLAKVERRKSQPVNLEMVQ